MCNNPLNIALTFKQIQIESFNQGVSAAKRNVEINNMIESLFKYRIIHGRVEIWISLRVFNSISHE